jgi:hypothetical protein
VRKLVVVPLLLAALLASGCGKASGTRYCTSAGAGGCTKVPADASQQAFCRAGAAFSSSVGFSHGLKAAKELASVGTPADMKASARAGFVELVQRMVDSANGPDFRNRTRHLADAEKQHLLDLDSYISTTCANAGG